MTEPAREYNLGAINDLLTRAFMNEKDLRRFLRHRKAFQAVLDLVSVDAGLADHVDVLIEYCRTRLLFEELLDGVQAENPRQYERLAFQLGLPVVAEREAPSAPPPAGVEVTPPSVIRPINLSFDGPTEGSAPSGWFNSLGYVGGVSTAYEIRVVPRPGAELMLIAPFIFATFVFTTSIPTPRPERSETCSAVEKPAVKMRLYTS